MNPRDGGYLTPTNATSEEHYLCMRRSCGSETEHCEANNGTCARLDHTYKGAKIRVAGRTTTKLTVHVVAIDMDIIVRRKVASAILVRVHPALEGAFCVLLQVNSSMQKLPTSTWQVSLRLSTR